MDVIVQALCYFSTPWENITPIQLKCARSVIQDDLDNGTVPTVPEDAKQAFEQAAHILTRLLEELDERRAASGINEDPADPDEATSTEAMEASHV
jgi:hypothetical protein